MKEWIKWLWKKFRCQHIHAVAIFPNGDMAKFRGQPMRTLKIVACWECKTIIEIENYGR